MGVYSPPRIAMYGKQLRKFGESLLQKSAVSNGFQPQEAALLFSKILYERSVVTWPPLV